MIFIKKIFVYNKAMAVVFAVFIFLFVFIGYKWGVVATPLLQYGMYSSISNFSDTQTVYLVEADNRLINNSEISVTDLDVLQIYIENYEKQDKINKSVYETMKNYINYTGLSYFMTYNKYSNQLADSVFANWYKTKVEKITGRSVNNLKVWRQQFVWKQNP